PLRLDPTNSYSPSPTMGTVLASRVSANTIRSIWACSECASAPGCSGVTLTCVRPPDRAPLSRRLSGLTYPCPDAALSFPDCRRARCADRLKLPSRNRSAIYVPGGRELEMNVCTVKRFRFIRYSQRG